MLIFNIVQFGAFNASSQVNFFFVSTIIGDMYVFINVNHFCLLFVVKVNFLRIVGSLEYPVVSIKFYIGKVSLSYPLVA
jgi:hypothetical protein